MEIAKANPSPLYFLVPILKKIGTGTFILSYMREKAQTHNECINIRNVISSVRDSCIL